MTMTMKMVAPAPTPVMKPRSFGPAPDLVLPRQLHRDPMVAMTPDERAVTGMVSHANRHAPGDLPVYVYRGVVVSGWDWRERGTVDVTERVLGIRGKGDRKWAFGAKRPGSE